MNCPYFFGNILGIENQITYAIQNPDLIRQASPAESNLGFI